MNYLWRFNVLHFKRQFIEQDEQAEYHSYDASINAYREKQFVSAERDDKETILFGQDDLKFSTFVDLDYMEDPYSDKDKPWMAEPDFKEKKDEVHYILFDFWVFWLFIFF